MRDDVLRRLAEREPCRLSDLARALKVPRWTVHKLLHQLLRAGLVTCQVNHATAMWSLGGLSDARKVEPPTPQSPREFCVGGACYEVVWDGRGSLPGYANLPGMGSALKETQRMINAGGRRTGLIARD